MRSPFVSISMTIKPMRAAAKLWLILPLSAFISCSRGDPDRGKLLFQSRGCAYCHTVGKGEKQGPDLSGVDRRYNREQFQQWLLDPEILYRNIGRRPLNKGYPPMPRISMTEEEIKDLTAYLQTLD